MSDQTFEKQFWGTCVNTYGEETKQFVYAKRMRLATHHDGRSPYNIDMGIKSVIDIGGGPASLLLKCKNLRVGVVVDPMEWPRWVYQRYQAANIVVMNIRGEDAKPERVGRFNEAWIYNCLQHVDDPLKVIANACAIADRVRLFEWIDIPPHPGHPHMLTAAMLRDALGRSGNIEELNESGCVGRAFFAVR